METNQVKSAAKEAQLVMKCLNENLLSVMETGNRQALSQHLSQFKAYGQTNFPAVLAIPSSERILGLLELPKGRQRVSTALTASIKSAMTNFNLRVGLNEDQMIDIAEAIIDQAHEDNLSLEDVLLFLQKLVLGQAGKVYDRMDIPTFFELFETYRQDRHEALQNIRYEQNANYKAAGPSERASQDTDTEKEAHRSALGDHMRNIYKEVKKDM